MLSNLSDVTLSSLAVNQILKWNGSEWVTSADDDRLAILWDVTLSSVSNNQVLQYISSLLKWVYSTSNSYLSTLTDCSIFSHSNDQLLVFTTTSSLNKWIHYTLSYNGTTWTNQSLIGSHNCLCDLNYWGKANLARLLYSSSN